MHPMSPPRRHRAPMDGDGIGGTATGPEVQAQGSRESPSEKGTLHLPLKLPGLTHNEVGMSVHSAREGCSAQTLPHPGTPHPQPSFPGSPELLF